MLDGGRGREMEGEVGRLAEEGIAKDEFERRKLKKCKRMGRYRGRRKEGRESIVVKEGREVLY